MNLEEVNSEKNGKKTSKKSDETSSEEDEALLLKNDIKRWVPTEEEKNCTPYYDFLKSLFVRFDNSFVVILVLQNFNFGVFILVVLEAIDLFKSYMDAEPGDVSVYKGLIFLPWSLKVVFGLITDNFPIFGLKRKPYLVFFGYVQFIAAFSIYYFDHDSPMEVVLLLMVVSFSMAFSNVTIDAMIVTQARQDPRLGSQDLLSLAWFFFTFAGTVGCIISAIMLENCHPKYAFLGYSIYGLFLGTACLFLNKEAENEFFTEEDLKPTEYSSELQDDETPSQALRTRQEIMRETPSRDQEGKCRGLSRNINLLFWALTLPEIYRLLIYFVLDGITNPSFQDFFFYFILNDLGVSKFLFAIIFLVGYIFAVFGVILYETCLKEEEVRFILLLNVIANIITTFLNLALAMRWNQEIDVNDYVLIFVTDASVGTLAMAFQNLPTQALFAKICPKSIEGSLFALLTSVTNFDTLVLQPLIGAWINYEFVGVTKDDMSKYSTLCLIAFCCSFIGFALLPLIPLKKDIKLYQKNRRKQDIIDADAKQQRRDVRQQRRLENRQKRNRAMGM